MQRVEIWTIEDWNNWLKKNHLKEERVELLLHKKHTGKPSPSHMDLMHEAICWGWIDTTIKRLDEDRYIRKFARRNDKSRWSNATLSYGKKMIEEGRMQPYGLKRYKEGKKKPVIDHGLPRNPEAPEDLKKALGKDAEAFEKLAPSFKRYNIYYILKAVQPETRARRIKQTVKEAREKLKK